MRKSKREISLQFRISHSALRISERDPYPHLQRSEGDVIGPFPRMQVNNEQRRRGEETRLGAQQPAIGTPVVRARALIQLLGVTPHVPAVRSQCTRVLSRTADIEQRIPLAPRMTVFPFREDGESRDTQ